MSEFNECYPIANPMETLCTVLSEVKISPVYNALAMETELWHGRNKVGHITFQTDVVSGRNIPVAHTEGGQSMSILTTGDIDEFKEKIMKENNIEDQSGLEIIVQYRSEDTPRLKVIKKGNWIDMYADEDVTIPKGSLKLVNLGVAMKLPEGYEGHLAPRSSTLKNFKVLQANSVGVVDSTYCGPNDWWRFPAFAVEDTTIKRGERICQFRIMEIQPNIRFTEGKMVDEDRGGFGSTGTK